MIEMRLLEIMSTFAEAGTQAAAAERLHISQPTLSSAMKKLEEEIGAPLFERTKNRMVLNENGKAAAEYANRILREETAMRQQIQQMERRKHTISLATVTMSALGFLTGKLQQAFPEKQITTSLCPQHEDLLSDLLDGRQTMIVTDQPVLHEDVYCFPCYTEHMMVLVPEREPEAQLDSLSLDQLTAHQLLVNSNGGAWDRYIRKKMPSESILGQSSFDDWRMLIESSVPVWAFISDSAIQARYQPAGYRFIPVSDEDAHLDYWCSCLKQNKKEADKLRSLL
ncbi:MAG: LysR family transcriptional regulator [Clostridia bacterium]|nr:LysR family transcriptional regulator [Clostridia bacterium]